MRGIYRGCRALVASVVVGSVLSGFAQAFVLVALVRIAELLAGDGGARVTELLGASPELTTSSLITAAFVATGIALVLDAGVAYAVAVIGRRVVEREQRTYFAAYQQVAWPVQAEEPEGHLQLMLTGAAVTTANMALQGTSAIVAVCSFFALGLTALLVNPIATACIVVGIGILLVAVRPLAGRAKRHSTTQVRTNKRLAALLGQLVALSKEITTFDVREPVRRRVDSEIEQLGHIYERRTFLSRLSPALFRNAAIVLVLGSIAVVYGLGVDELGALAAVVLLLVRALSYGQALQSSLHTIQESSVWKERLDAERDEYALTPQHRAGAPLERIASIGFRSVSFSYVPGHPVLHQLTFEVPRGETIGIVGPSGGGKSTLVQLLLRLREPTSGSVMANDVDAAGLALEDWYRRIAFVPQEPRTFNGSVAENISFFRADVTPEDIEQAARRAHLHDEVVAMPDGYDTMVGERGGKLSGGQRQRLSIARALVGSPDVLILDEPTSALDMASEQLVQRSLEELHGTVTLFIIAHRLSTLSACDRLMVLEHGRLVAFDRPEEVEARSEFFRNALRLSRL